MGRHAKTHDNGKYSNAFRQPRVVVKTVDQQHEQRESSFLKKEMPEFFFLYRKKFLSVRSQKYHFREREKEIKCVYRTKKNKL